MGFSSLPINAQAVAESIKAKAKTHANVLLDLSDKINPTHYDVDALAEKLEYEPTAAIDLVVDDIYYSPYVGVMRGPSGTLSTASGSSWDQAVLLAALVNNMGGETMLAVGKLEREDAEILVKSALLKPVKLPDGLEDIDFDSAFKTAKQESQRTDNPSNKGITLDEYLQASESITSALIEKIRSSKIGFSIDSDALVDELLSKVSNHYVWVRFRNTPHDEWQDIHPAFPRNHTPQVAAEKYISASVPQEKLHRVSIQIDIEKWSQGAYSTQAIMKSFVRPAANLSEHQIRVGIAPSTADVGQLPTFFVPTINGALPEGGKAFNIQGTVYDAEDAAAGPAIFETVASQFGAAIENLGNDGEESTAPRLTGAFLTISVLAPDGEKVEEVRRLFDFRQSVPTDYSTDIVLNSFLEVDIGKENNARDMKNALQSTALEIRQMPYHMALIDGKLSPSEYVSSPAFQNLSSHPWSAVSAFNHALAPAASTGLVFRSSPLVMLRRVIRSDDYALGVVVDIQHNAVAGIRLNSEGDLAFASDLVFQQGVKETLIEGELIGISEIAEWTRQTAGDVIKTSADLQQTPFWQASDAITQERILNDLKVAGMLFLPEQSDHWWRIDPNTANVLGMGLYGGSEMSEESLLTLIVDGISILGFGMGSVGGAAACNNAGGTALFRSCCIAGVVVANGALMMAGGGLTGTIGTRWGAALGHFLSVTFDVFSAVTPYIGDGFNSGAQETCKVVAATN